MGEVSLDQRFTIQDQDGRHDIESFVFRFEIFRCRKFVAIILQLLESLAMTGIRNRFSHAKRLRVDPSK